MGREFGFNESQLDEIKQKYLQGGQKQWMSSMLDLKMKATELKWEDVIKALESIGQYPTARNIHQKYCSIQSGMLSGYNVTS